MGKTLFAALCIALPALVVSCNNDSGGSGGGSGGSSVTSTGGAQGGSGGSASGGSSATGGSAAGGSTTSSSGGKTSTGGSTGGAPSTGGTTASGGTTSSGGVGAGGTTATGGKGGTATGGTISPGTGGSTNPGTGGTARAGGTTGSGGTTGAGGTAAGGTTGAGGSTAPSDGYPLGNPAVPSAGCGKALSTFKSGSNTTYKMTSAGISREYIMYIPSNYDAKKPYRLVFGMHCMGSSATQCANGDGFYRLKPLDTGNTTIFVAPQGYTDSMPWRTGKTDDKDHVFFDDMVKLFKSELCIDESRVFSVGFSFGAMFTNALAQTHQAVLRAVTVYATADYNIYFPANTGKPLAYMGVHGTTDGTCPFSSGQSSIKRFVNNNKCTGTPIDATTSTHVVFDYTCPSNYPVKWATHTGGHTDVPTDPGQSKAWTIDLTWKWITQF